MKSFIVETPTGWNEILWVRRIIVVLFGKPSKLSVQKILQQYLYWWRNNQLSVSEYIPNTSGEIETIVEYEDRLTWNRNHRHTI